MVKEVKLNIHSIIDVITNSSTEIFVHSEDCIEPAKELLSELLRVLKIDKSIEDLFDIKLKVTNIHEIISYYFCFENKYLLSLGDTREKQEEALEQLILYVIQNKIEKPDWYDKYDIGYHTKTIISITSKDEKYNDLLTLIEKLLYSPHYYEHSSE